MLHETPDFQSEKTGSTPVGSANNFRGLQARRPMLEPD
jgi:hypothetical protein